MGWCDGVMVGGVAGWRQGGKVGQELKGSTMLEKQQKGLDREHCKVQ